MDIIYAQSRMEFIKGEKPEGCVFCKDSIRDDNLVLYENDRVFVIMNKYPYNTGHLLVIPRRHVSDLDELTEEEDLALMNATRLSARILKEKMCAQGLNIGMNLGKAAGAGIDDHMHIHIVPRWGGDSNFITTIGCTRVIPEDIKVTYKALLPHFEKPDQEG
ncbi:MAG: HIT domain-containing protein [Syntrophaceae bacterium]